jgi:hypothetical protein
VLMQFLVQAQQMSAAGYRIMKVVLVSGEE